MADLQAGNPPAPRQLLKEDLSKASRHDRPDPASASSDWGGMVPGSEPQPKFGSQQESGHPGAPADQGNGPPASSRRSSAKALFPPGPEADAFEETSAE